MSMSFMNNNIYKVFMVSVLILNLEYCFYNILNNYNTLHEKTREESIWIPPMMTLLTHVVYTVNHLVTLYFITFNHCFCAALDTFNSLIYGYYHLLEHLITCFLHFPTNIIAVIGMGVALYFIYIILCIIKN